MKYMLTHKNTNSVYAALNTLSAIKDEIESQQGKEMLVCGKEGIEGYVNPGMPLCYFPENSHVVITFSKTEKEQREDEPVYGWQDHVCIDYVKFYIHAVGKRNERILKFRELHQEGNKLCVYGFKGDTIKETLRKDGRFYSFSSDSVELIVWNNKGNEGCATCFVLTGLYIFTCWHVINDIMGERIEQSKWADKTSQCVKVTFDYEEFLTKEDNSFFVEPWFEMSDYIIDYAVLKLKKNGQEPSELYNGMAPVPSSGLIYIIGHPDVKQLSDGCVVISQDEHIQEREVVEGSNTMQYICMYTQRSFQETGHEPGVVTCDNTFYCGSSGSPIFDSNGPLVAMHTAVFICEYESGVSSISAFGSSIKCILSDIKQKIKPGVMRNVYIGRM
uniref:protein FAM111A-like n=1 Tax=Arvicanthis niloticus TaxID=61156 RepID=UPI001486035F|nr:protein FAM111A-like [Arvicanthis niloticus]